MTVAFVIVDLEFEMHPVCLVSLANRSPLKK